MASMSPVKTRRHVLSTTRNAILQKHQQNLDTSSRLVQTELLRCNKDLFPRSNSMQTIKKETSSSKLPMSSSTNCLLNNSVNSMVDKNDKEMILDNKNDSIEQLLKVFTRKKKVAQVLRDTNKARSNNGQFRDYFNDFDILVLEKRLKKRFALSDFITLTAKIVNFAFNKEMFYKIEWSPKNM
jgi:hypothetical protein